MNLVNDTKGEPMTKDEAIELLDCLLGMVDDNQGNDYDEAFHMAIDALKKQPEPQWIPCSDCERRCDKWEHSKTSQE